MNINDIKLEPCKYCRAPAEIVCLEYSIDSTRIVIHCTNCGVTLDWTQTYYLKQTNTPRIGTLVEVRAGARNLSAIEVWNGGLLHKSHDDNTNEMIQ